MFMEEVGRNGNNFPMSLLMPNILIRKTLVISVPDLKGRDI